MTAASSPECMAPHRGCRDPERTYCICRTRGPHSFHQCACGCRWTDKETDR